MTFKLVLFTVVVVNEKKKIRVEEEAMESMPKHHLMLCSPPAG